MSKLFNTLNDVLTPYANKINLHSEEIEEIQSDVSEVKADLGDLNEFCHKEIVDITTGSRSVTSGTPINKNPALVNCDIPSGTTYKFTLNANGRIGTFFLYANGASIKNGCVPETAYEFTASERITEIGIYANAANVIGTGTITGVISISTPTENSLEERIGTLSELDTTNKSSLVSAINEVKNNSPVVPLPPEDTTFFHVSKNMIDPSKCVDGEYVNQATGAFATLTGHKRTGYIVVSPNTTYVIRKSSGAFGANFRYAFYTEAKAYISGAVGALNDMLLTSPNNAKYIAISETENMELCMIAPYINEDKSFEAYSNVYILPHYIVAGDADNIILNVPSKIYALVGYETNIYFENITDDWTKYKWDVTCTKGMQLERGYRITPSASDVGTYTLTIRASITEAIYKEVSTTLVVTSASAGNGQTKTVIVLGDSTTDNGTVISKLHDNFANDVMSVTTLGTRGTTPNNHEGRSGWTIADYFTKASITYTDGRGTIYNPFYNPSTQTFDASYYFTNSGVAIPDVFIINMGINDVFGYLTDTAYESGVTTILQRVETAIQSILDATTTTKVCVCLTIPPNHSQDAFGKAYACSQTRNRCKRNNTLWVQSLIEEFSGRESERVYIIPINACLDTVYNMGMETLPVNARNTDVTYQSPILNGGVHPVASGYWQIADVYTAFLKANA